LRCRSRLVLSLARRARDRSTRSTDARSHRRRARRRLRRRRRRRRRRCRRRRTHRGITARRTIVSEVYHSSRGGLPPTRRVRTRRAPPGAQNPRCQDLAASPSRIVSKSPRRAVGTPRRSSTRRDRHAAVAHPGCHLENNARRAAGRTQAVGAGVRPAAVQTKGGGGRAVAAIPRARLGRRARGARVVRGRAERDVRARRDQTIFHPSFGELSDHDRGRKRG